MVGLAEVENLADDLPRCGPRRPDRRAWAIGQSRCPVRIKPPLPPVEGLAGDPEMAARARDVARALTGLLQYFEAPRHSAGLLCLGHRVSTLGLKPREENEICYGCPGISHFKKWSGRLDSNQRPP